MIGNLKDLYFHEKKKIESPFFHYFQTVRNLSLISRENCRFLGSKTRENVVVSDFLAVDNLDFTRKIVKKMVGENVGFFVKIEFLNRNLTF